MFLTLCRIISVLFTEAYNCSNSKERLVWGTFLTSIADNTFEYGVGNIIYVRVAPCICCSQDLY